MPWWNPATWFGQGVAKSMMSEANTATLRNALKNYVNAVNKLNNKNNKAIFDVLMMTKNGMNSSYKNRIVNGVAKIVAASRRSLPKVMEAVVNGQPEGPAAANVNNVAAKIKNLNNFIRRGGGGTLNNLTTYYKISNRDPKSNRLINETRKDGARYAALWSRLNEKRGDALIREAIKQTPPVESSNNIIPEGFFNNNATRQAEQKPRPANQRPANQRPANQRPANQRPANQRPANQTPPRPANQRPANQRPANQTPPRQANQRPANQKPKN